ncbi:MAG: transglutaminase family protein [Pseudomonadota bacterium]|nr:transglutaminase family protein [Pseudomonadota bacterium]
MSRPASAPPSQRYRVLHETVYTYSAQVSSSRQVVHLHPRETPWQRVLSHRLDIEPRCTERSGGVDYFGNRFESFFVDEPHQTLIVRAESEVIVAANAPAHGATSPPWELAVGERGVWKPGADLAVEQYRAPSPAAPVLARTRAWAAPSFKPGRPWLEAVFELTQRIPQEFEYDPEATNVFTSVAEVLELKRGVCQDYAHLMLSALRSLGMAARYVSGYVLNSTTDGARLTGADASHAWVAVWCPGLDWVAFDPTNGKLADQEFVTLGWGREYLDVTPLRGVVLGAASQQLAVAVKVMPVPSLALTADGP